MKKLFIIISMLLAIINLPICAEAENWELVGSVPGKLEVSADTDSIKYQGNMVAVTCRMNFYDKQQRVIARIAIRKEPKAYRQMTGALYTLGGQFIMDTIPQEVGMDSWKPIPDGSVVDDLYHVLL